MLGLPAELPLGLVTGSKEVDGAEGEAISLARLASADRRWVVQHHLGLLAKRLANGLCDANERNTAIGAHIVVLADGCAVAGHCRKHRRHILYVRQRRQLDSGRRDEHWSVTHDAVDKPLFTVLVRQRAIYVEWLEHSRWHAARGQVLLHLHVACRRLACVTLHVHWLDGVCLVRASRCDKYVVLHRVPECVDYWLARLHILPVVVVHNVKRATRVGLGIPGVAPADLDAVPCQLVVVRVRSLLRHLFLVPVVHDRHAVPLGLELLSKIVSDEGVATTLGVDDEGLASADADSAPAGRP
mmetsp:Transcript_19354/g.57406  ORF Transcript_19354/g.57406 Transcript_19354/m.57406 type:complete len:299 (-) Transcript_19354:113-1009(-)